MKVIIATVVLGLFATLAVCQHPEEWAVYDRPCAERKAEMREAVKDSFSVAAVSFRVDGMLKVIL